MVDVVAEKLYEQQCLLKSLKYSIEASDNCMTYSYYGRSSRAQLPEVYAEISRLQLLFDQLTKGRVGR